LIYGLIYQSERCDHPTGDTAHRRCRDDAALVENEIRRFLQNVEETGGRVELGPFLKRWQPVFGLKGVPVH